MNAQRIPGRRPAAWVRSAVLALVLAALPVGSALATPVSIDGPYTSSIAALWQYLSGWMGRVADAEEPRQAERAAEAARGAEAAPGPAPALTDDSSTLRRSEGEDGYKIDPSG